MTPVARELDVVVIGGGQAALATGFYLRRTGLSYLLLDDQERPGAAWHRTWRSLRLFSPAQWSSLPGWLMPRGADEYPTRDEAIAYLTEYERRYGLPVLRPVHVHAVRDAGARLAVETGAGTFTARAVVSATGTWANPVVPKILGRDRFEGVEMHSAAYRAPDDLAGKRVVVVGGGNSGAQIVADLAAVADVTWATRTPPRFLPEHVDGRVLFEQATARYKALQAGQAPEAPRSLGDIVIVEPVREALAQGRLEHVSMFTELTADGVRWPDGRETREDVIVWATGFCPALAHLAPLGVLDHRGRVEVRGSRSLVEPRLWLVGYGDWTGFASATLIGVGRSARSAVEEIAAALTAPARAG